MTLTKLFINFIKEENIYYNVITKMQKRFYIHDTMIDNLYYAVHKNNSKWFDYFHCLTSNKYPDLNDKWLQLINSEEINIDSCYEDKMYNYNTTLVKNFIKEYNIENDVISKLYSEHNIVDTEIKDNEIDILLRFHNFCSRKMRNL